MENNREEFSRQIELLHFAHELEIQQTRWKVELGLALYILGVSLGVGSLFSTNLAALMISIILLIAAIACYIPNHKKESKVRETTKKKLRGLGELYYDARTLNNLLSLKA
jgi:hypothetical protein